MVKVAQTKFSTVNLMNLEVFDQKKLDANWILVLGCYAYDLWSRGLFMFKRWCGVIILIPLFRYLFIHRTIHVDEWPYFQVSIWITFEVKITHPYPNKEPKTKSNTPDWIRVCSEVSLNIHTCYQSIYSTISDRNIQLR